MPSRQHLVGAGNLEPPGNWPISIQGGQRKSVIVSRVEAFYPHAPGGFPDLPAVTGVRVERLRDMVLGDVLMEGIKETDEYEKTWDLWHQTWNSTIKPKDLGSYGWEANPWVWVISFERIEKPADWGPQGGKNG